MYCCGVFISNGKDRDDSVGVDGDDSGDGGDGNYKAVGWWSYSVFDNVVVVIFQITFRAEMHANDVFLFLKNYF